MKHGLCIILLSFFLVFSPGSADFGLFEARYGSSSRQYCAAYDGTVTQLPKTVQEEDFSPLLDLRPSTLCELPEHPSRLQGHIVEMLRNSSALCKFNDSALNAEDAGAVGMIIVSEQGIFEPSLSNASIEIPVVLIASADIDQLYKRSNGQEIIGTFFAPEEPNWDASIFLLLAIALFVVTFGGFWSGLTAHKKYLKKTLGIQMGSPASAQGEEEEEDQSVQFNFVVILIMVVCIVSTLLLLYFFYFIFVYVIIVIFGMGSWSGLYVCLNAIVKRKTNCSGRFPTRKVTIYKKRYSFTTLILVVFSLVPVVIWFVFRHETWSWILLDTLGIVFCISVFQNVMFSNLKTCTCLLLILFVYDIFFVFITPLIFKNGESVMIQVATGGGEGGEQLPMLFKVPHLTSPYGFPCQQYSLLGFGDVLVPGFLISYLSAFDLKVKSKRIYYIASSISYALSLVVTFVVLIIMRSGQPALLYIVPFTLTTTVVIAVIRKELKHIWTGTEESDEIAPLNSDPNKAPTPDSP